MRPILIVLFLCVIVLGALFGALNGAHVTVDFHFAQADVPLGGALLCALLLGWLLGGLVAWLGHLPGMRRQARSLAELRARVRADVVARGSEDG
jgi:putative membrane protein